MSAGNGNGAAELPVLGSAKAPTRRKRPTKTTVNLPARGVSLKLEAVKIKRLTKAQDEIAKVVGDDDSNEAEVERVTQLAHEMLVEPKLAIDALREEVEELEASDFVRLQTAVYTLAGMREMESALEAFQGAA